MRISWVLGLAAAAVTLFGQVADTTIDVSTPVFDATHVHTIELTVPSADWKALKDNYLLDTYYKADFLLDGEGVRTVGIRSRGCGSRSPVKPGLKVSFDKYVKNRTYLEQKALVLINLTQDPPMLREYLSMQLFRKMGMAAPRQAFTRVFVNGELLGLYLMSEEINTPFLARTYHNSGGWLYDYEWAFNWNFEELPGGPEVYSPSPFQPETNKSEPKPESLQKLVATVNRTTPAKFIGDVAPLLDLELFLRHVAIEVYVGEHDGMVGDQGANNFYLYEPGSGASAFVVVPWDKSSTLYDYEYDIWRNFEKNTLLTQAMQVPLLKSRFLDLLRETAVEAGGQGGWLDKTARSTYDLIRPHALADKNKPYSNAMFSASVADTLFFIRERNRHVDTQLKAEKH